MKFENMKIDKKPYEVFTLPDINKDGREYYITIMDNDDGQNMIVPSSMEKFMKEALGKWLEGRQLAHWEMGA